MTNCLQCGKELTHVEGRKRKHFCDNNCKNKHFYAERQKLIKAALSNRPQISVQDLTKGTQEVKSITEPLPTTNYTITPKPPTTLDEQELKKQIADIRAEKIPAHRDSTLGRKSWQQEQQKRISELQKQINSPI